MRRSQFRPDHVPDAGLLDNHRPLLREIERRGVIRGALSLGALSMLTGCDVSDDGVVGRTLKAISAFNDKAQLALFNPNKLAPTYRPDQVLIPPRFNAFYDIEDVKPVDGQSWRLQVSGLVQDKRPWTREQFDALPQTDEIIRHICVEGWDYIGQWSGPTLRTFLTRIGADLRARYVTFQTADDYPSIIDMATALHPQTLLATRYARQTLDDPYGFPLRLRTAVKLGLKNPKWITAIEVSNKYTPGYWERQGEPYFEGL